MQQLAHIQLHHSWVFCGDPIAENDLQRICMRLGLRPCLGNVDASKH